MHFLLIPYGVLCALFFAMYASRQQPVARFGMLIMCSITMTLFFLVIWWRPVAGDSWRYMEYFMEVRNMSLSAALNYQNSDLLYALLNWSVGQFGSSPTLLFGSTLSIYFFIFIIAIKKLLPSVETLVVLMCYSAFPYFIAYGANGLRQGIALVFLLMAFSNIYNKNRLAWLWLILAPLWHSGAWLAVFVLVLHQMMCKLIQSERMRWIIVLTILLFSISLSFSGINGELIGKLYGLVSIQETKEIYFTDAATYGYQAGFRLDFFAFSLLPLISAILMKNYNASFDYEQSGWWLSLYLCLNVIYHIFSFAPFSDRFAALSWFFIPLIVYLQIKETRVLNLETLFMGVICSANLLMLQLYTGNFIPGLRI